MRILALETTGTTGSVAIAAVDRLVAQIALDPEQRSARSLAPAIKRILAEADWKPADVELVALPLGPGSFTGLRIGVMTAKAFAYAVGAQALGLDSLEVVASQAPEQEREIAVAMNAQRKQVYAGLYSRDASGRLSPASPIEIVDVDQWARRLGATTLVTGPALDLYADQLPRAVRVAPRDTWHPTATAVARLAFEHFQSGQRDDLWALAPRYYRRSAAEEKASSPHGQ